MLTRCSRDAHEMLRDAHFPTLANFRFFPPFSLFPLLHRLRNSKNAEILQKLANFSSKSSTKLVRKKIIFPLLFLLKELKLSASAHDPHFSEIVEQISKEINYFSATVFLKWIESAPASYFLYGFS